ncbi:hypothetical protein F5879DRAFT_792778, partial [Lentinula edodes]
FCRATGSKSISGFQAYVPVDKITVDEFAKGTGPGPEAKTAFHLYFGDDWRKMKWNRNVVQNLNVLINSQKEQARIAGSLSPEVIDAYLWDLIAQSRVSWRARKPRPHATEHRWETVGEAVARAEDYEARREKELRVNSRKRVKYEERKEGLTRLIKASPSALDTRKWQMVQNVLLKCGTEAQSSDYTDSEADSESDIPAALHTGVPYYRRSVLSHVFEDLDRNIKELNKRVARDTGKRIIPRATRVRIRTHVRTERTVVKKLPKSCYHRRYLESLDAIALDDLQVKMTEIDLFDQWADTQGDSDSMQED